jgi:hypothetical protein
MTSIIGFLGALAFVIGVSGPVLGQAPPKAGPLEDIQSTLAEILAALGNLTTDVSNLTTDVSNLKDGYVPFNINLPNANGPCATPGLGSPGTGSIKISSPSPFLISSVRMAMFGIDEIADSVRVTNVVVDGQGFNAFTREILSGAGVPPQVWFDILGGVQLEKEDQAKYPLQLASNGGGDPDIGFGCRAGTTTDLTIGRLQVSGWKDHSEDVVVVAD